jgi:hypothetical protein
MCVGLVQNGHHYLLNYKNWQNMFLSNFTALHPSIATCFVDIIISLWHCWLLFVKSCCSSSKHASLIIGENKDWLDRNQDNMSYWSDTSTFGLWFQWTSTIKIHPLFYCLFAYLFSIKFKLFESIFMQSYVNNNLHESTLYDILLLSTVLNRVQTQKLLCPLSRQSP